MQSHSKHIDRNLAPREQRIHPGTAPQADAARCLARRTLALVALVVFAVVLGIDFATKTWANVVLTEPVRITDWLYLMLHYNSGLFLGTVPVSAGYWVGVVAAMGWFGWRALRSTSVALAVCLAAALAGLAGNAIGQARGAVVDFIGVGPITGDAWLVMNVADIALVAGGLALGVHLVRKRVRRAHQLGRDTCGDRSLTE